MPKKIEATNKDNSVIGINVDRFPDTCPVCKLGVSTTFQYASFSDFGKRLYASFRCPISECRALFIGIYSTSTQGIGVRLESTKILQNIQKPVHSETIQKLSEDFCAIYEQAYVAESNELNEICGGGYRRALEYLIKDYLIKSKYQNQVTKQDFIRTSFLGNVIKTEIDNPKIKDCASRAVWLGNDSTHYVRKWADKDINDLKTLIHITAHFIEMEITADKYLAEMPGPK